MHGVFVPVALFSHSLFIISGVQLAGITAAPSRNYVINYFRRDYVIKLLCVCVDVECACEYLSESGVCAIACCIYWKCRVFMHEQVVC